MPADRAVRWYFWQKRAAMQITPYKEIKKRYRNKRYTIRVLESDNERCHLWCKYFFQYIDNFEYCLIQEKMEPLGKVTDLPGDTQDRTEFCLKVFGNGGSK